MDRYIRAAHGNSRIVKLKLIKIKESEMNKREGVM